MWGVYKDLQLQLELVDLEPRETDGGWICRFVFSWDLLTGRKIYERKERKWQTDWVKNEPDNLCFYRLFRYLKCSFNRCVEAPFEAVIGRRWRSLKKVPRCRRKVVSDPRSGGVLSPERRPEAPACTSSNEDVMLKRRWLTLLFYKWKQRPSGSRSRSVLWKSLSSWLGSTDVCSCNFRYLLSPIWSLYLPKCWLNMYHWIWGLGWRSWFYLS